MANKSESDAVDPKPIRTRKNQQTVRQRAEKASSRSPRRLRSTAGKVTSPLRRVGKRPKKEFNVIPLPNNRAGTILGKRVRIVPPFVRDAWYEIRQVTWPSRGETVRLTLAVFIFAVVFAAIVGIIDYGLDKLFREVILK